MSDLLFFGPAGSSENLLTFSAGSGAASAEPTNVLEFDGTGSLKVTGTLTAILNGAHTMVAIIKPVSLDAGDIFVGFGTDPAASTTSLGSLAYDGSGRIAYFCSAEAVESNGAHQVMTAGDWQIVAASKVAGTAFPRQHRKVLGSGAWDHSSMDSDLVGVQITNKATVPGRVEFARGPGGDGAANTRFAAVAVYASALTDAQIESIQTTPSTAHLVALGAAHVWKFNGANVGTSVQDLVGDVNEASRSGTTVITDDPPTGWVF